MKVGIMGGTGIYDSEVFQTSVDSINTPYGKVVFERGVLQDEEIFFLPRHGKGHSIPPHLINYRANIAAFKELGVERILATSAVGSLRADLSPGTFVVLNQFLDFTKRRALLFDETSVKHIDFTEPYCKKINTVLRQELKNLGIKNEEGCYVCTEGPRYETPAEVKMFSLLGGDVVGMTNVPEVTLAKEAGICYGCVSTVTNLGAGIGQVPLRHEEVVAVMEENSEKLKALLMTAIPRLQKEPRECGL